MITIKNRVISADVYDILLEVQKETNQRYLQDINRHGNSIMVTCPYHANHSEKHPSCGVISDTNSDILGFFHCFTCGEKGSLSKLVADCFNEDISIGEEWLCERFGNIFLEKSYILPEINIENSKKINVLHIETLNQFTKCYHPYMEKRKISKEVAEQFSLMFDQKTNCIVFPIWDENNNLVMITKRSIIDKHFYIDEDRVKPVYLYNFIKKYGITNVYVCESQINALTLWSWGYPAIALIGTGSKQQYEILNKSGITVFNLALDGDIAGDKGIDRFIKNIRKDVLINVLNIPRGKDVNDLTKEEFDKIKLNSVGEIKI